MNIIRLLYMENKSKMDKTDKIKKLYENLKYFDVYGGSFIVFLILIILLFLVASYAYIQGPMSYLKKHWVTERCKPYVIPFAGFINKPHHMSVSEYTEENFNYCAQNILKDISSFAVEPIEFIVATVQVTATLIDDELQSIREMFYKYRENLITMFSNLMSQILNFITPLQVIIIKFGDVIAKIQGSMTAGLYTAIGAYMSFQVFLDIAAYGVAVTMIIISAIMFALIPLIIILYAGIVTIPIAAELNVLLGVIIVLYVGLMIPLSVCIGVLEDVFGATIDWQLPPPPPVQPTAPSSCFDKNTLVKLNDGREKKIIDIEVGDVLINNNMVTAKLKLSANNSQMYELNGIIVSGTHSIIKNNNLVKIETLDNATKISEYQEPYIYCINTENKIIEINDITFCDWDEISEHDIVSIKIIHKTNKYKTNENNLTSFSNSCIHSYFDGGFAEFTKIKMIDGNEKEIKNVEVGDILENNEKVYGIVEINGETLRNQYKYNLGKKDSFIVGGPNLNLCDKNIKFTTTINIDNKIKLEKNENKLYHLVTDKKSFYVEKIRFYDYNASIELLLEKNKGKLLSMKYV